ncbi:hypothetical protein WJX81_006969 [Elliptochloris bilobata]|uniref:Heat shock factor binding protein 1 n=1 Tax=Elliptochloris bilobata TaxID=381761 RepID=A0AAW1SBN1_9CHLO
MAAVMKQAVPQGDSAQLAAHVQSLLTDMQSKFQTLASDIVDRIDDVGKRIDQLEGQIEQLGHHAELRPEAKRKA